jgi:hypothetical protein
MPLGNRNMICLQSLLPLIIVRVWSLILPRFDPILLWRCVTSARIVYVKEPSVEFPGIHR